MAFIRLGIGPDTERAQVSRGDGERTEAQYIPPIEQRLTDRAPLVAPANEGTAPRRAIGDVDPTLRKAHDLGMAPRHAPVTQHDIARAFAAHGANDDARHVRVLSVAGFARRLRLKRETRPVTELHDSIAPELPGREGNQPFTVDPGALA